MSEMQDAHSEEDRVLVSGAQLQTAQHRAKCPCDRDHSATYCRARSQHVVTHTDDVL